MTDPAVGRWKVGDPAPLPPKPPSESDLTRRWRSEEPVVSVLCATYQHAQFVENALDGMLAQETDFAFEVLLRDDASSDGTADIVRAYAERYPSVLQIIMESTNRWPDVQPFDLLRTRARGRFIALCEGDDYWLDPNKLQKQVEHLERNPDAVVSHHQSLIIESGHVISLERLRRDERIDHSDAELRAGGRLLTNTVLFRNIPLPENPYRGRYPAGIKFLRVALGTRGGSVYSANVIPSVYRRHAGGISSGADSHLSDLNVFSSHFWLTHFMVTQGDRRAARVHAAMSVQAHFRALEQMGVPYPRPNRQVLRRTLQRSVPPGLVRTARRLLGVLRAGIVR